MNKLIVDLFAGGGGASTGIENALQRSVDIAINHDCDAIAMHQVNHPNTLHYIEDIWDVDPLEVTEGKDIMLLWASPDCTHFSKARGGKPKKKNIRSLAWVVVKWARLKKPAVIMLENVEEFQTWGPLDENQVPIKEQRGETFERFINELKAIGYDVKYRLINAADYKTPTTRKRLFLIARCDKKPIIFPEAYVSQSDYVPAKDIIDWDIPGKSIFEREKPLSENTMKRIWRGFEKHVIKKLETVSTSTDTFIEPFVMVNNSGHSGTKIDYPLSTITSGNHHFLIIPFEEWKNKQHLKNDDFITNATLYFGIGYDEARRTLAIIENWKPFNVEFPLIDIDLDEKDYFKKYDIEEPRLYKLGFSHNNCGGRCIKAGQGHYKILLEHIPERFHELMEFEILCSEYIRYTKQKSYIQSDDYLIAEMLEFAKTGKKTSKLQHSLDVDKYRSRHIFGEDSKGNPINKPYSFLKTKRLLDIRKQPDLCSIEIGGCGCFIEYD